MNPAPPVIKARVPVKDGVIIGIKINGRAGTGGDQRDVCRRSTRYFFGTSLIPTPRAFKSTLGSSFATHRISLERASYNSRVSGKFAAELATRRQLPRYHDLGSVVEHWSELILAGRFHLPLWVAPAL